MGPDGLVAERGHQLSTSAYPKLWTKARRRSLTPKERGRPLGERPYDPRGASGSARLNDGTSPCRGREWGGRDLTPFLGFMPESRAE